MDISYKRQTSMAKKLNRALPDRIKRSTFEFDIDVYTQDCEN